MDCEHYRIFSFFVLILGFIFNALLAYDIIKTRKEMKATIKQYKEIKEKIDKQNADLLL